MQPYVLVVDFLSRKIIESVLELRHYPGFEACRVLFLTTAPEQYAKLVRETSEIPIHTVACNFDSDQEVRRAIDPYAAQVVGVACRGDRRIQYLRMLVPYLPSTVRVAPAGALQTATNKQRMRAAFMEHYPEITPRFVEVGENIPDAVSAIESAMPYPVIAKPANLASSLLIQACTSRDELVRALSEMRTDIAVIYAREGRRDPVQVIVEEYLEGDFYSIDAYSAGPGTVYYCPPVAYIPAKQLGIDDFFLYKRYVPPHLDEKETERANEAVFKALTAIGLVYSSAHVELVRTKDGWKIIEIGPRLGRFRIKMYEYGYNIDHSLNDLKIHLGLDPVIPKKPIKFCAAYSIYPHEEGVLDEITKLAELQQDPNLTDLKIFAQPGDVCRFARHGGHALAEFIVAATDEASYDRSVQFIESNVFAKMKSEHKH